MSNEHLHGRVCEACGKTLRAIGRNRSNGRYAGRDWPGRRMHVKCWRERR